MIQHSKPVFVLMPQWQGSSASRAMRLIDGAAHLRRDLPASALLDINVPVHAGDSLGTPIARLSALLAARNAVREALLSRSEPAITLGGDSSSTLAGLERASALDPGVAVLWFDARPRLEHPSTSPSGAAEGMVLRHILGDGVTDLALTAPVSAKQILLIGTRDIAPEEEHSISEFGLQRATSTGTDTDTDEVSGASDRLATPGNSGSSAGSSSDPGNSDNPSGDSGGPGNSDNPSGAHEISIQNWLTAVGARSVYVHIALDVLDPASFSSLHSPVPFGMSVAGLTSSIRAAVSTLPLAGATITEFAPADDEMANNDAPTVLRILAALLAGGGK